MPDLAGEVSAGFAQIATLIEERKADAALLERMRQTQDSCKRLAATNGSKEKALLLTNVQEALSVWQEVWPRLGAQREFRQAVAREAKLWAKRLAPSHPRP